MSSCTGSLSYPISSFRCITPRQPHPLAQIYDTGSCSFSKKDEQREMKKEKKRTPKKTGGRLVSTTHIRISVFLYPYFSFSTSYTTVCSFGLVLMHPPFMYEKIMMDRYALQALLHNICNVRYNHETRATPLRNAVLQCSECVRLHICM